MISSFTLLGIVLGLLALVILLIKKKRQAKLEQAVVVLLAGSGTAGGLKVFVLGVTLTQPQLDSLQIDRIYLIIGGVAIVWVLLQAIYQRISAP